jgi:hypothetical protein
MPYCRPQMGTDAAKRPLILRVIFHAATHLVSKPAVQVLKVRWSNGFAPKSSRATRGTRRRTVGSPSSEMLAVVSKDIDDDYGCLYV